VTPHPILLRANWLLVGRRVSGFVLVAQCLVIGPKARTRRVPIGVLLHALSSSDQVSIAFRRIRELLQLGVLCVRLPENRDVGVRAFPDGEKIPVGSLRLDLVSR
jgi:hypothetical protein